MAFQTSLLFLMHSVTWNCEARQDSTPHLHLSPPGTRESHPEAIGRFRKAVCRQCVGVRCPERIGNAVWKGEFWNEVIVEAEELRNRLIENPLRADATFMYSMVNPDGKKKAQEMQQQIQRGEPAVPIVEMDPEVGTRCTAPSRLKSRSRRPHERPCSWRRHLGMSRNPQRITASVMERIGRVGQVVSLTGNAVGLATSCAFA